MLDASSTQIDHFTIYHLIMCMSLCINTPHTIKETMKNKTQNQTHFRMNFII